MTSHMGRCDAGAKIDMIDDMEDGDGSLFLKHGRAGVWFSYNDDTNADSSKLTTQWPQVGAERFPMEQMSPPRAESKRAAHTRGAGYTNWGAGIGFDLLVQQQYDASLYAGLRFYLRGVGSADTKVRLNVTDVDTSPLGNLCDGQNNGCYSDFGIDLHPTEDWQETKILWRDLKQPGWTKLENRFESIVASALYGIRFQADPRVAFDFWIDDIAFLCSE